ncbi:MAG: hypothetical protein Q9168_007096 [Polycauliona sp. 1 TL-2023]
MARYCVFPNGEETEVSESITEAQSAATAVAVVDAQTTAVTDCHMHQTAQFCVKGDGQEVMAMLTPAGFAASPPTEYTGCRAHGEDLFCYGPDTEETLFVPEGPAAAMQTGAASEGQNAEPLAGEGGRNCHFHAGDEFVLLLIPSLCEKVDGSYNMPIRIGTLFVMLVTSAIAVFAPILLVRFAHIHPSGYIFTVLKQFGTGVIISTALVHLSDCRNAVRVVATKSATQHAESMNGHGSDNSSQVQSATKEHDHHVPKMDDPLSVFILEMGIILHSAIIGVTLVVTGDSFYKIFVVVIIFHQMFEGLAVGVLIANLNTVRLVKKLLMASAFALITPLGMAIGMGVLDSFNGNNRSTIIAIGTLDAFSAGILLWTGFVQMWSSDWLYGDLRHAGGIQTALGMFSLVSGIVIMSVLGKWG